MTQPPTRVVNIRGRNAVHFDVYIGRAGHGYDGYFGNPFKEGPDGRMACIKRFEDYFYMRLQTDDEFKRRVLALNGKRLGCFCKPRACHGDIIAAYLNALDNQQVP